MKRFAKSLSLLLAVLIMLSSAMVLSSINIFAANGTISYSFTNAKAGYAQGTISLKADNGKYWLYWSDNTKALTGYTEIATVNVSGGQGSFTMPKYTAIPGNATKVIAIKSSSEPSLANCTVAKASAVYSIPSSKQFNSKLIYTFGSISDPQLANDSYGEGRYPHDETHFAKALETLAKRNVDFTVLSGDVVNDQNGNATYATEFKRYQRILADSSYAAPIYEANGNHDVAVNWKSGSNNYNTPFIKGTGLDGKKATINAGKPYFEVTEPKTGDHFIFMALEGGFYTNQGTQFSDAQLNWLEGLLKKYKNDGKNIFIIEHANVEGWGSGDKASAPFYYDLGLNKNSGDVKRFIKLMETYKDCVIITGHTHLELAAQLNYSDNNGTSAVMIHNSAIGGVRRLINGSVNRDPVLGLSEGYIVEVYEDGIIFNGANMYHNEMMPQYCYIVPMTTSEKEVVPTTPPTTVAPTTTKAPATAAPTTTKAPATTVPVNTQAPVTTAVKTEPTEVPTTTAPVKDELAPIVIAEKQEGSNLLVNAYPADGEKNVEYQFEINGTVYQAYSEKSDFICSVPYDYKYMITVSAKYADGTVHKNSLEFEVKNGEAILPEMPQVPTFTTEPVETTTDKVAPTSTTVTQTVTTTAPVVEYLYGDVDLDGKINVKDATQIQKYAAKLVDLDEVAFVQADVTGDIKVNVKDATAIQKFVAKIIDKFPVEEVLLATVSAGTTAKQDLDSYYTYSSYDQYMALKKAYRNSAPQAEITKLQNALYDIMGIGGGSSTTGKTVTVYFENNYSWDTVKIYAWTEGGEKNGEWPGVPMTKQSDGKYSYQLDLGKYQNIIFNNGGSKQTEDIYHPGTDKLVYAISGGPENKLTVTTK
ncbi:MAG: starch-binding protein [Clostridia bacterium]|nr:starch-binding protein [Clostridia bacterium]